PAALAKVEAEKKACIDTVRVYLDRQAKEIEKALNKRYDVQFFVRACLTHVQLSQDPNLLKCDPKTILAACVEAAQIGLLPDSAMGDGWILSAWSRHAFGGRGGHAAQFRIGYKGLNKLARRSGDVT